MYKVTLTGNLVKTPELTETKSGISVCRFSLAVNRKTAEGENKADYYRVTAWRGLGENVAKYCKKGSKILLVGNIELNSYTDKDGIIHPTVDVVAQDIEFLSTKKDNDEQENDNSSGSGRRREKLQSFDYDDDEDGEVPF